MLQSGTGFSVDELGIRTPSSVTPANSNLGISGGCPFMLPATPIPNCANVIPVGPGDVVPADALVIVWMSNDFDPAVYDWSGLCNIGQAVYLLQNSCDRTAGAFVNGNCSNCDPRTIEVETTSGCTDALTYDPLQLNGTDGDYYTRGDAVPYGNSGCAVPPVRVPPTVDCSGLVLEEESIQATCAGDSMGSLSVRVVGGTAPYAFTWLDTTATGPLLDNLPAGNYTAIATDADGCIDSLSVAVPSFDTTRVLFTDPTLPPVCAGDSSGQLSFQVRGAYPVTYFFDDPNQANPKVLTTNPTDPDPVVTISGLDTGNYLVYAQDANGCVGVDSIRFDAPMPPDVLLTAASPSCPGDSSGQLIVTATGASPFTYAWNDPALQGGQLMQLDTGIYEVTVTDANGCSTSATDTLLAQHAAPGLTFSGSEVLCPEDCLTLPLQLEGTAPFGILYDLVNANGVRQLQFFQANTATDTLLFCAADLGLAPGAYTLDFQQVADSACTASIDTSQQFELLPESVGIVSPLLCPGDSLVINGQVYNQANPSGRERLEGAAANGCDSTLIIDVQFYPEARGQLAQQLCPGAAIRIGGIRFDEENPSGIAILPNASATGCDSIVQVDLSFRTPIETLIQETLCATESITVGNQTFNRSRPSGRVVLPNQASTGCDSTVVVDLDFLDQGRIRLFGGATSCNPDSIALPIELSNVSEVDLLIGDNLGRTFSYQGINASDSLRVPGDQSGVFTILRADNRADGCPLETSGSAVLEISRIQISVEGLDTYDGFGVSCPEATDGQLTTNVTGGIPPYVFNWNTGDSTSRIRDLSAGNYRLVITDDLGCEAAIEAQLMAPDPMQLTAEGISPVCNDQRGVIRLYNISGGAGNFELSLNGTDFQSLSLPDSSIVRPGIYPLFLRDGNGCTATDTVTVLPGTPLELTVPLNRDIAIGEAIELTAQTNFPIDSIQWEPPELFNNPNSARTVARPSTSTLVTVTAISPDGCVLSDQLELRVNQENPFYVPNIFSPNEDGRNDRFRFFAGEGVESILQLRIWSRWGNLMFEAGPGGLDDPSMSWDGNFQNQPAKSDTYVYQAEVLLLSGQIIQVEGTVALVR